MPELPDLQVFSRNLQKKFAGKALSKVTVHQGKKMNATEQELKTALEGSWLKHIKRDGKELYFHFSNSQVLGVHLMLKGEFHEATEDNVSNKIMELDFGEKNGLIITDLMGQAKVTLNPTMPDVPDALAYTFNFKYLKEQLSWNPNMLIKSFLMDQHKVRGIGNAYVDEILWESEISPFSKCGSLPDNVIRTLLRNIKKVLKEGERQIKRLNPNIIAGELREFMKIHNPSKTHSPKGEKILVEKIQKRKTYYTESQVLYNE